MAKLTVVAAVLLVALLAMASASAHRTTITTTLVEDENLEQGGQSQRCQQRIQQQQQRLYHCQRYLAQRSPFELDMYPQQEQEREHLRECCQGLRNLDEQCRCEAVRQAVRQQQQQGGGQQGEEMQQMMEKARQLPRMCNLGPRECQIRTVFI